MGRWVVLGPMSVLLPASPGLWPRSCGRCALAESSVTPSSPNSEIAIVSALSFAVSRPSRRACLGRRQVQYARWSMPCTRGVHLPSGARAVCVSRFVSANTAPRRPTLNGLQSEHDKEQL